ncbi:hypothetical protein CAI21_00195 [Alkalilimnicola ehrlichii]|uniref:DUF5666 domain-containing protein n=1 Tax=Alkalilimnicola ehrlichii TaxID=351052 RepID=A0A3E0X1R2_9GAMM|nr:DUF5666 domain-containing protein [Alkalilimnicola ehrlichii]RFA31122.1 hypothetical protein CAI21_00195 [Alkalilimnicola ehrlichii]RFA39593.1 hypothetical protein CAL65_02210 [Alkalilimnicola ehrlichii]
MRASIPAAWSLGGLLLLVVGNATANDIEGEIASINDDDSAFTVQGIEFFTDDDTDYNDGLNRFEDLAVGQRVEVDFEYRDERHFATEIELED